jgi:hypothetical protein
VPEIATGTKPHNSLHTNSARGLQGLPINGIDFRLLQALFRPTHYVCNKATSCYCATVCQAGRQAGRHVHVFSALQLEGDGMGILATPTMKPVNKKAPCMQMKYAKRRS